MPTHGFTENKEKSNIDAAIANAVSGLTAQITTLTNKVNNYWKTIYPVGSIYTTVSTSNPATLFGGTWERYGVGRTLVGVDTSQSDFKSVNKTGGAKSNSYTPRGSVSGTVGGHKLTVSEMPSHNHTQAAHDHEPQWDPSNGFATFEIGSDKVGTNVGFLIGNGTGRTYWANYAPKTKTATPTINSTGGNGSHNHGFTGSFSGTAQAVSTLQPYVTVYFWRRTA